MDKKMVLDGMLWLVAASILVALGAMAQDFLIMDSEEIRELEAEIIESNAQPAE